MFPADLPPQFRETLTCSVAAAARYDIPAAILLAIAESEAGRPGLWVKNQNGTSDVGPMQFNTAYLTTLAKYGITPQAVAMSGCYAYDLAAWRLRQHLRQDQGDIWTRAANYHSRTPYHNALYREGLITKSARWADWLDRCASGRCVWIATAPTAQASTIQAPAFRQRRQARAQPHIYVPRAITPTP
jgi:hypothetical protein